MLYARTAIGAFLSIIFCTAPALAEDCDGLSIAGHCLIGGKPEIDTFSPGNKDQLLTISPAKGLKSQNQDELYKVHLTCDAVGSPKLIDWGPFAQTNIATSHIVALTSTRLSSSQLPSDAKVAVTIFSVSGDKKNRSVFKNDKCDVSFAISGRDKLFISASANKTTTNEPGPLATGILGLIQVALPILPLFSGVGAATTILKGASQTSDPLTKLYQQLDRGTTVTQSERLYQGPNIVRTPYSTVRVTLSKIKSVIDDEDLVGPYETIVTDAYNTLKLDDKQPADLAQGCRRFDGLMQNRNLSPDDISYGLVLLTRLAGFDQTKTLTCMGPDYAQSGLAHKALWKRYGYEKTPLYTEADAKAFFYSDDINSKHPRPSHKEFAKIQTRLEFAMNSLVARFNQFART